MTRDRVSAGKVDTWIFVLDGAFTESPLAELVRRPPDLATVINAWPTLPEPIRTAIRETEAVTR